MRVDAGWNRRASAALGLAVVLWGPSVAGAQCLKNPTGLGPVTYNASGVPGLGSFGRSCSFVMGMQASCSPKPPHNLNPNRRTR